MIGSVIANVELMHHKKNRYGIDFYFLPPHHPNFFFSVRPREERTKRVIEIMVLVAIDDKVRIRNTDSKRYYILYFQSSKRLYFVLYDNTYSINNDRKHNQ